MAIQAPNLSNITNKRTLDEPHFQPAAMLRLYPSYDMNQMRTSSVYGSRKRTRNSESVFPAKCDAFNSLLDLEQGNLNIGVSAFPVRQATTGIATDLCLSLGDIQIKHADSFADGTNKVSSSSILKEEAQRETMKRLAEFDQFIRIQGERMKQIIEERSQNFMSYLLASVNNGILTKLNDKEVELENLNQRNSELEECVKQLSLELQLWQSVAKNNEIIASKLRTSLEHVVVPTEDAESHQHGESPNVSAKTFKENEELKEQLACRACRINSVCILLLPCRHLCLCRNCERKLDLCPICRSAKYASVQVKMT